MARAVLERVVVDKAIEVVRQRTGHGGGATRAGTIREALHPRVGKAMDPFAQCRRGKMERVRDRLEAVPFDDFADGLGTPEHPGLFGLFQERVSSGKGIIGKVKFEGPHRGGLQKKLRQKFIAAHRSSYWNNAFSTQISLELLVQCRPYAAE